MLNNTQAGEGKEERDGMGGIRRRDEGRAGFICEGKELYELCFYRDLLVRGPNCYGNSWKGERKEGGRRGEREVRDLFTR